MADVGIKISTPGIDSRKANKSQLLMSSSSPFLKLDTQSQTSFQTVLLLFNNDPPEPVYPTIYSLTVVYKFAHGFKYTPRVWSLFQVVTPPIGTHFTQSYFQDVGVIGAHTADDEVEMYISADSTYVYINVNKFNDGLGDPNNLIGTLIKFTIFTFVDDLSGT